MTILDNGHLHTLRQTLQAQFDQQTDQLVRLTAHRADPEHNGLDPDTVSALIDSTRQAVADTTEALKRIAQGTYGHCEHCQQEIPPERLRILPHARFCVPCQSRPS